MDADADMAAASLKTNLQSKSSTSCPDSGVSSAPASSAKQPELGEPVTDSVKAGQDLSSATSVHHNHQHDLLFRNQIACTMLCPLSPHSMMSLTRQSMQRALVMITEQHQRCSRMQHWDSCKKGSCTNNPLEVCSHRQLSLLMEMTYCRNCQLSLLMEMTYCIRLWCCKHDTDRVQAG